MNSSAEPVAPQFAWYQVGSWETLEQGDLLSDCPALVPPADLCALLSGVAACGEIEAATEIQFADQIILSQSCDLANDKIQQETRGEIERSSVKCLASMVSKSIEFPIRKCAASRFIAWRSARSS